MIDRDIHLARALLVESNRLLRHIGAAQLRDVGVGHVTEAGGVRDARALLEREPFDIIVCNREFEGPGGTGQDLLDELRREHLLPHGTVFLMVTSQARYHQVVEAGEAALDAYLVRPYTTARLAERLTEARRRKRELGPVLQALHRGETGSALVHALDRFRKRRAYWAYSGRLAAELLLNLQRPQEAQALFERLSEARPDAVWARLGQARARIAQGDMTHARQTVAAILADEPESADAHDLLGRILVEQCEFDAALIEYRSAAELTPGCLLRSQHAGALAFYLDQSGDALRWLERTLGLGIQSKLFDALSLLLIAMLRFDLGDAAGVAEMRDQLRGFRARYPDSRRLQRLELAGTGLADLIGGRAAEAQAALRALAAQAMDETYDLEAANMTLALWSRVPESVRGADEFEGFVERVAMRFCISKAIAEVLAAAGRREISTEQTIRRCQSRIAAIAEAALENSLRGDPAAAAAQLLEHGEQTLNAKLLEMAGLIAKRHEAHIPDAQALGARAGDLLRMHCRSANHIAGIQRSGRSPGSLQLRVHRNAHQGHGTDRS